MPEERPEALVVPTELGRQDAFIDLAVLAATVLLTWYLALRGLLPYAIPALILVALWALTGEPAEDIPYLGGIATGLRSKLGWRRAHEWALAWWSYSARPRCCLWLRMIRRLDSPEWKHRPLRRLRRRLHQPRSLTRSPRYIAALELRPTTSYGLASHRAREDQMVALSRVLMGLSHPIQLIASARPIDTGYDWPNPPRISRRWLAVVEAPDATALAWRLRTLQTAFESVGLSATEVQLESARKPFSVQSRHVQHQADSYVASLVLRRWPREVAPGWLGQALAGDLPVDLALHIEPQDAARIARFLKRQAVWQNDQQAERPDAANAIGRRDAEVTRQKLIARTDRPVRVAAVLTVHANDTDTLRARVETLGHEIGLALGDVRLARFEQNRGLAATQPTGRCDLLGAWRTLDCTSVASTWPFQPPTVFHQNGADIGTTRDGSMLVRLDPFDMSLRSFGGLITGSVGSGKSYLLKLLLRRLGGVEKRIVEHSDPPEYDGVPDLQVYNVADLSESEQAVRLREYITNLWALARADPRPRLLVLDELWSVLRRPELASLVEEVARRGRKYGLALWIASQQIEEIIESGKSVFDNAAIRIYLEQADRDLEGLCKAAHLSDPARRLLRGAARGQALIQVGRLLVFVDVQASPDEHTLVTTDPRDVWNRYGDDSVRTTDPDLAGSGGRGAAAGLLPVGSQAARNPVSDRRDGVGRWG